MKNKIVWLSFLALVCIGCGGVQGTDEAPEKEILPTTGVLPRSSLKPPFVAAESARASALINWDESLTLTMDKTDYNVGETPTYTVTGGTPKATLYWTSTVNGVSTGETNHSYVQMTDASGSWSALAISPWIPANVGTWVKTVTVDGRSSSVTFTVVPSLKLTMDKTSYNVGETPTYTVTGGSPNATLYWTSTVNGASTGETNHSYGQQTDVSGSWSALALSPWISANVGTWVKTVTVDGRSSSVTFTVVPSLKLTMDKMSYNVGETPTYTVTGGTPKSTLYWTSTVNGVSTGETNHSYGQMTDASGSWSALAISPWIPANVGTWVKTVTVDGRSSSVTFTVVPSLKLTMDKTSYNVGETPTYTVTGGSPNATLYWTSTVNGASTGETNHSYGQQTDVSGSWSALALSPWISANVGTWVKTVTVDGRSSSVTFSVR